MPPPIPYCFPVIQPDTHALKLSLPVTPKETIFLPPAEVFFSIIIDNIQVSLFLSLGIILGQIWHFRLLVKAFFVSAIIPFTQISVDFVWVNAPGFGVWLNQEVVGWQKDYLEAFVHLTPFFGSNSPDSQQLLSPETLPRKNHKVLTWRPSSHYGRLSYVAGLGAEVGWYTLFKKNFLESTLAMSKNVYPFLKKLS